MAEVETAVVIVGAGAAGLAAARTLHEAGIATVVLEARDRIGGRILTHRDEAAPIPVELGAEFVHGDSHTLWSLLREARLAVCDVNGGHVSLERGSVKTRDEFYDAVESFVAHASKSNAPSVEDALASWKRFRRRAEVRQTVRNYVEGFHAAHPERFSVRAFVSAEKAGSEKAARVVSGYDGVPRALARGLDVRLEQVVTAITWWRGAVNVTVRRRGERETKVIRARSAIVTLPLAVLRAPPGSEGAVHFDPGVPSIIDAASRIEMGVVARIALRFRDAFWEQHPDAGGASFFHSSEAVVPTWWTSRPMRTQTLVGWLGGPRAETILRESSNAMLAHAIDSLAAMFAMERGAIESRLETWHLHDWLADPFTRGAYSYIGLGGENAPAQLATPVEDTLFFAGEATHATQWGTVHGAMASGRRAARQVIASIA